MRYYEIQIYDDAALMSAGVPYRVYSSLNFPSNKPNMGALQVEFDLPMATFDNPMGGGSVKIWGVSIGDIGASAQLSGKFVKIYGGMVKGLPLANPLQNGLLLTGRIRQAFGNWQGVEQNLTLIIDPAAATVAQVGTGNKPPSLVLAWQKGQRLSDAIATALNPVYSTFTNAMKTSGYDLIASEDTNHVCSDLTEFAGIVNNLSIQGNSGGNYGGVKIFNYNGSIAINDFTQAPAPTMLNFTDFIGQPVWNTLATLSVVLVLRADLNLSDMVSFEAPRNKVSVKTNDYIRNGLTFTGKYRIVKIRHVGNFRQQDAHSWITALDLIAETTP